MKNMDQEQKPSFLMFLAENSSELFDEKTGEALVGPDTLTKLFENGFEDFESISMINLLDLKKMEVAYPEKVLEILHKQVIEFTQLV